MLNKQTITHAKAFESAQAFISEHFENPNDRKVRVSVPVQASDDDVLLTEYIRQQEADSEWRERWVQELEEALELCMSVIWSEFHTGPEDAMNGDNEADIAFRAGQKALEWREQIRKPEACTHPSFLNGRCSRCGYECPNEHCESGRVGLAGCATCGGAITL